MNSPNKDAAHREFPWDFRLKTTIRQLARGRPVTDREIRDTIIRVLRAQVEKTGGKP